MKKIAIGIIEIIQSFNDLDYFLWGKMLEAVCPILPDWAVSVLVDIANGWKSVRTGLTDSVQVAVVRYLQLDPIEVFSEVMDQEEVEDFLNHL